MLKVMTIFIEPSASPKLAIAAATDTTALLRWQHLPCISTNGQILRYILIVDNSEQESDESLVANVDGKASSFWFSTLKPNSKYHAQISAANEFGAGPYSNPVPFRTRM